MPAMLVVGEIHTCLLHNHAPLPRPVVAQVLELLPGRRVISTGGPVERALSPERTVGVDCRLATASQVRARGVGTVTSYAAITGGMLLQGSSRALFQPAETDYRRNWSHYASQPGVIEVISRADAGDLAAGFLADRSPTGTLDLGSVSEYLVGDVQMHPQFDHVTSVRSHPTRVRWTARVADLESAVASINVENEVLRTIELTVGENQLGLAVQFCEDFALHDWLLTTIRQVLEQADRVRAAGREPLDILGTAVERLLHLWMPGARVDPAMRTLWEALERRPGFSLQWNAQVARIRDQITLQTLQALEHARRRGTEW